VSNYWVFDNKNALEGVSSTLETLEDCGGRVVTHPDETNPAVLSETNIIYALQTSRRARNDFQLVFPSLSAGAQARLTTLIEDNPRVSSLMLDDQKFMDQIQRKEVRSIPVRTCGRRGGKGYGGGA
jgi:hypothetical protein